MRTALFVVHTNTYFGALFPAALALRASGDFEPLFLFPRPYPTQPGELSRCEAAGVKYEIAVAVEGPRSFVGRVAQRWIDAVGPDPITEFVVLRDRIARIRDLLRSRSVGVMVLAADNRFDQAAYVRAAHLAGVPAVIVPQFMAGPLEWAESVYRNEKYFADRGLNRIVAGAYPRWTHMHKGRRLVALPAPQLLAREWLGIAPLRPWILHSGFADAIAVESEAVRNYCIAEGLPPEQVHVTGSASHDIMAAIKAARSSRRNDICVELGLDPKRPVLLSALPPDSIYMGRPDCDFKTYHDLVRFWCDALQSVEGWNVVMCLHPSADAREIANIAGDRIRIAAAPAVELIPLCDLFVASISATIQWAIACGTPVINYDVYRYCYTDYDGARGVIRMEERSDFLDALRLLTTDPVTLERTASAQRKEAGRWGRLDGRAMERLGAFLNATIVSRAARSSNTTTDIS
jgi:hypothetical protein